MRGQGGGDRKEGTGRRGQGGRDRDEGTGRIAQGGKYREKETKLSEDYNRTRCDGSMYRPQIYLILITREKMYRCC